MAVTTHAVQDIPSKKRLGSLSSFLQRGAETKGEGQRPRGRGRGQGGGVEAKGEGQRPRGRGRERGRQEQAGISAYVQSTQAEEGGYQLAINQHLSCNRRLK